MNTDKLIEEKNWPRINTNQNFYRIQCHRVVYYESYQDARVAITREKQLKRSRW